MYTPLSVEIYVIDPKTFMQYRIRELHFNPILLAMNDKGNAI
jgi:hypothetical protein